MRVTICELPHGPGALATAWVGLRRHTTEQGAELVLLPEFALLDPVWEGERFDQARWDAAEAESERLLERLRELHAPYVVGTRPVSVGGRHYNEGFLWSDREGLLPLRRKAFFPDEPGGWEARWFDAGEREFPVYRAGAASFGLNICTELWALETYAEYAAGDARLILSPRATSAATRSKWLAVGTVAAVRAGAYSVSSNRVDRSGAGGGAGWIIDPEGRTLAVTSAERPFITAELDLDLAAAAKGGYPRYVFQGAGAAAPS